MRKWAGRHPLLSFSLVAVAWLSILYSGVLSAPFIYDDLDQIVNNPALSSWHQVYTRFFLQPVSFTSGFLGNGGTTYRPLFWLSLALDQHLWGTEAAGFHFTSLLLHGINGLLLFTLLRRFRLSLWIAAIVSLLWLGLPIQSESVAWISARAYPLSTAFLLLASLCGQAYLRGRRGMLLGWFFLFALLANLSHEQGVFLLAFVALGYGLGFERQAATRWTGLAVASVLADVLYFAARYAVGSNPGNGASALWSVGEIFWKYMQLIVLPIHMSMERSTSVPANRPSIFALIAWATLFGVAVMTFWLRKRNIGISAGLGLLLLALLPYCGFVFIYQGMAERFTYIPSIGLLLALVLMIVLQKPTGRNSALCVVCLWCLWGGWRTITRIEDWQQPEALFRHSLEATPQSAYLQDNLGVTLRDGGDQEGALTAFREAVRLRPDNASAITAIGDIYAAQGHTQQALDEYRRALSLHPQDVKTILNYATALNTNNSPREAEDQYKRVISLLPKDSAAYVDLEALYIKEGRLDDAIEMYKRAIAVNPNDANAYFDLGVMFQQRGQDREALAFYKKVLQLKPGDRDTLLYLSKLQNVQQQ